MRAGPQSIIAHFINVAVPHLHDFDITFHFRSDGYHFGSNARCIVRMVAVRSSRKESHARAYLCTSTTGVMHLCSRDPSDSVVG